MTRSQGRGYLLAVLAAVAARGGHVVGGIRWRRGSRALGRSGCRRLGLPAGLDHGRLIPAPAPATHPRWRSPSRSGPAVASTAWSSRSASRGTSAGCATTILVSSARPILWPGPPGAPGGACLRTETVARRTVGSTCPRTETIARRAAGSAGSRAGAIARRAAGSACPRTWTIVRRYRAAGPSPRAILTVGIARTVGTLGSRTARTLCAGQGPALATPWRLAAGTARAARAEAAATGAASSATCAAGAARATTEARTAGATRATTEARTAALAPPPTTRAATTTPVATPIVASLSAALPATLAAGRLPSGDHIDYVAELATLLGVPRWVLAAQHADQAHAGDALAGDVQSLHETRQAVAGHVQSDAYRFGLWPGAERGRSGAGIGGDIFALGGG